MKIKLLSTLLLTLALGCFAAFAEDEPTPLEKEMKTMNKSLRTLKKQAEDAMKNAKSDIDFAKAQSEFAAMAAQIAAMKWEFTPALSKNKPVDAWVPVPIRFKLKKV